MLCCRSSIFLRTVNSSFQVVSLVFTNNINLYQCFRTENISNDPKCYCSGFFILDDLMVLQHFQCCLLSVSSCFQFNQQCSNQIGEMNSQCNICLYGSSVTWVYSGLIFQSDESTAHFDSNTHPTVVCRTCFKASSFWFKFQEWNNSIQQFF